MPFFKWSDMASDFITPSYSKGIGPAVKGETIEVAYIKYPSGTVAKPHSHPNEQVQAVLIPANTEHELEILEDMEVINCKNVVPGWSVHDARWEKQK